MIKYDAHSWLDHLFDVRGSLLKEISNRVLTCCVWATAIYLVHHHFFRVNVDPTVHSLVGLALGLLLVFRTNSSYDRFWEGRKLWGGIVNETRNLIRTSEAYLVGVPEARREIALWTIAFVYGSMHSLQGRKDLGPVVSELNPDKVQAALNSQHPTLIAARNVSMILHECQEKGEITEYARVYVDQNVQLLIDYLGGCERIHKTPLPFAYVVHLRRALIFYFLTLPFALVETFQWSSILAVFMISFVFFGIEEIGVEIEDPFGVDDNDLPLEEICQGIERNLMGLLTDQKLKAL